MQERSTMPGPVAVTGPDGHGRVFGVLEGLEASYPGFGGWYRDTVAAGGDDRLVLAMCDEERVLGVGIFKRGAEDKVCTLWVDPAAKGLDLGPTLLRRGLEWIGNPMPLVTVPEERMGEFVPLFRRFGMADPVAAHGLYRTGRAEFIFNGKVCGDRVVHHPARAHGFRRPSEGIA